MNWWRKYGVLGVGFGLAVAACSRGEEQEAPAGRTAEAITSGPCNFSAPPPVGTPSNRTFTIKVPNGTTRAEFALSTAGGVLTVNDAVQVIKDTGGYASVSSVEATNRLWLGPSSKAQNAFSELTGIEVRSQAHLYGFAKTASTVIRGAGSLVDGATIQNTSLKPLVTTSWVVAFPGNTRGNCILQPDQTQIIDPGAYGTLTINARAHLKLRTGTYYFRGLTLDGDSLLDVDNTAGPVYVYIRDSFAFNGTVVPTTATKPNLLLGYAGTTALNIQRSLWGILVAPNSNVTLAPTGTTGHTGSFFSKSLTVQASTTIHHRPFGPTDFCPGSTTCSVLCPCGPGGSCQSSADCQPGLSCTSGVCTSPNIDDGNPCTADSIDPNGNILHTPLPAGASCSDSNLCNGEEVCNATAQCLPGTVPSIDDGNACTADACTPAGGITHTPVAAGTSCSNGSACDGDEACNGTGTCQPGTPPVVDDGNPCTSDACTPSGGVTHTPLPGGTSCADSNVCNGLEACNATGVCQPGVAPSLDDQNACTADSCDPATGIHHDPVPSGTSCADADLCNGGESCDGAGTCVAGVPSAVDDNNPCTIDACDPVAGVSHTPVAPGTSCDDGDLCNGTSTCNASAVCVPGTPPVIDDGNPCTTDACTAEGGVTHVPVPEGTSCADSDVCNGAEACNAQGVCTPGTAATVDDQNPCTTDTCDPIGGVTNTPVPAGTTCQNADACDGTETCNQNGTCVAGTPPVLDDGNPCTADACDPATGVNHVPVSAGTSCADGNACNGSETCDATGACQPGTPPPTDDGNPCTADSCDPAEGVLHVPVSAGTSCADGDVCNGGETCNGIGACNAGTPPIVDDGNPCTADACDPVSGVSHTPVAQGTSCADGNACNGAETCNATGSCLAGTPLVVDDQNPCTADSCEPAVGVVHAQVANGTACTDGNACTQVDSCEAGVCTGGQPVVCSAADQCHEPGTCDPSNGVCSSPAKPNGAACSDGNACTTVDSCQSGVCTGGNPITCAAADECHGPGTCNPSTGTCSSPARPDGTSCDDDDPCTGEDACVAGVCNGDALAEGSYCDDDDATRCNGFYACDAAGTCADEVAPVIDDANECTADLCDATTGSVTHEPTPGTTCGNACSGTGTCTAAGVCAITSPGVNVDDSDPCTEDACNPATGTVTHVPLPEGASCDTNGVCDGISTCSVSGECVPGTPPVLDDGNPCTYDSCDDATGVQHQIQTGAWCADNDQNLCNGYIACDESGACTEPATVVVDDDNSCTIDSCDPALGAVHAPDEGADCGDLCTGFGQCNQFGFCSSDNPPVIEDGDACTQDLCDPETGIVTHPPAPAGTLCGDGDPCNGTESCSGDGQCLPGTAPEVDDENPCTFDVCTTVDGGFMQIFHDPAPSGTVCGDNDADPCNGVSVCNGSGSCNGQAHVDDENPCTIDSCDLAGGIQHQPAAEGASCSDGDVCNGAETCDGSGACVPGDPVDPSDGNDCTDDYCASDGSIEHVERAEGSSCEDFNPCTSESSCSADGICIASSTINPDDGNPCTTDSCNEFGEVVNVPADVGTECAPSSGCAAARLCDGAGTCLPPVPVSVDDGNPCTTDGCDPGQGIFHTPTPGVSCSDGNACNGAEVCEASGACTAGAPPNVDDANPCTVDTCEALVGVVHVPAETGTNCGGQLVCGHDGQCRVLPPDPSSVAPSNPAVTATILADSTKFLYTGTNPIQVGVEDGTILRQSAGVLRGQVRNQGGAPLPGVVVSIKDHPELGYTFSREDGGYDLAVNGGQVLIVQYRKPGFLRAQRTVPLEWQDFRSLDDVVLVELDSQSSYIDFSGDARIARGSVTSDERGERGATLIFAEDTHATMVLPDGSSEPLPDLTVRATEYTVGGTGVAAMPADLPPSAGYTYAVEFSVDEAISAGAERVEFDRPVVVYIDNFVGVPAGMPVPLASYDFARGAWMGQPDAITIEILDVNQGKAVIDVDGLGLPATNQQLASFGIDDQELADLGTMYAPGKTLWRSRVEHFTPYDYNFTYAPPDDADEPDDDVGPDDPPDPDESNCVETGSKIGVMAQTLGHAFPLGGSPYRLNYSSRLVSGYQASSSFNVQLTGPSIPASLVEVVLEVMIAGRRDVYRFPPAPNLSHRFTWRGIDLYGRRVFGQTNAIFTIHYVYPRQVMFVNPYVNGVLDPRSWSRASGYKLIVDGQPVTISNDDAELRLSKTWTRAVGTFPSRTMNWDARGLGLGGWTVDVHNTYDVASKSLVLGTGDIRHQDSVQGWAFARIAGGGPMSAAGTSCGSPGACCQNGVCPGDGGPPLSVGLGKVLDTLPGADGSLLILTAYPSSLTNPLASWLVLRRISRFGQVSTVSRVDVDSGDSELDGLEVPQTIGHESGRLAAGPSGAIYLAAGGTYSGHVWRLTFVTPDQVTVERVAGTESAASTDEGVLATAAGLGTSDEACGNCVAKVQGLAASPDGSIYVATSNSYRGATTTDRVRRIGPDGYIYTIAGTGTPGLSGDGGSALEAQLDSPSGIDLSPDGSLYVADSANYRVRRVSNDGLIATVAGIDAGADVVDGIPAVESGLWFPPRDVAVAATGSFYISGGPLLRYVAPDGLIRTVSGGKGHELTSGSARAAELFAVEGPSIALSPDRSLIVGIADNQVDVSGELLSRSRILRIADFSPGLDASEIVLPVEDGSRLLRFDTAGRHLATQDAMTGATLLAFGYDAGGQLSTITDQSGNVTTFVRTQAGVDIVAPFGQTTHLSLDGEGYVSEMTDPSGATSLFTYANDGLMQSMTDARGGLHEFTYDALGRLLSDAAPDSSKKTLALTLGRGSRRVVSRTMEGHETSYLSEIVATGEQQSSVTENGHYAVESSDGGGKSISTVANGNTVTHWTAPDPRFGVLAPYSNVELTTPLGRRMTILKTKAVAPDGTLSEITMRNGAEFTTEYDPTSRTWTHTSAEGRVVTQKFDVLGRVVELHAGGTAPFQIEYDAYGRLERVVRGNRARTLEYIQNGPGAGYAGKWIDALGHIDQMQSDPFGRLISTTRGSETTLFGWDPSGNLTSVTMADGGLHTMAYTPGNLLSSYDPPTIDGVAPIEYDYDNDRRLVNQLRADGSSIQLRYDTMGRLIEVESSDVTLEYDYVPLGQPGANKIRDIYGPAGQSLHQAYDGDLTTNTTWVGEVNASIEYAYDDNFRPTHETMIGISGVRTLAYAYDRDGLLTCASATTCDPGAPDSLTLDRDIATGNVNLLRIGAVEETRLYNEFSEVASQELTHSGSVIATIAYDTMPAMRDELGRVVRRVEQVGSASRTIDYQYDSSERLTDVHVDGTLSEHFEYDANGNRILAFSGAASSTAAGAYDAQDRLSSYGPLEFDYGENGELTRRTNLDTGDVWQFHHDSLGRLVGATLPDGREIEYVLDGSGRRIGKKINGVLSRGWIYRDELRLAAELDSSGAITQQFVYGSRSNSPDYIVRGGTVYRVFSDNLGTPLLVVNVANVTDQPFVASYSAFGEPSGANLDWMPFGFGGGIFDPDTRLIHFGARDYDPQVGRWVSKDPIRFDGGVNLYVYVDNDPVNLMDPWGLVGCADGECFSRCMQDQGVDWLLGVLGLSSPFVSIPKVGRDAAVATAAGASRYTSAASWLARWLKGMGATSAGIELRALGARLNPYGNAAAAGALSYIATSAAICSIECSGGG